MLESRERPMAQLRLGLRAARRNEPPRVWPQDIDESLMSAAAAAAGKQINGRLRRHLGCLISTLFGGGGGWGLGLLEKLCYRAVRGMLVDIMGL